MSDAMMGPKEAARFVRLLAKGNPEPKTELLHGNTFQLLVAVVLSAQATDKGVNVATRELFEKVRTPAQMVELGERGLVRHIRSIGLFRTKARNVIALSRILEGEHGGKVPDTREQLEALPGVGRKTANVVLNCAFGQPTMAVDTHIFRIGNRTGIAPGRTPRQVEDRLLQVLPDDLLRHAHHWLVLHGRYTCTARKPKCAGCVANKACLYEDKTA